MELKKKYPCTQCIFLTTKESTLAKHMKRHQNVSEGKQVSKSPSLPSSATSALCSSSLPKAREREVVFEETKFKCQDCERIFNSRQALSHHTKSKHDGIKYACNQCNYQGTTQSNLTIHIQSKHEGVKYACNQCDYQATQQSNLTSHVKRKHL